MKANAVETDMPNVAVSAVDQIITTIEREIQEARLAPGQRLVEADLMKQFGVSRGPLREAFRRLTERGLLQWEHFKGVNVIRMTRQQVVDLSDIRAVLEGHAASQAALKTDRDGRSKLRDIEKVGVKAVRSTSTYDDYNFRFHKLIRSLSGNHELNNFVELTMFSIFRLQFSMILYAPNQIKRSKEEHTRIVEAIVEGDAKASDSAMRQHVQNTAVGILQAPAHFFAP
jgi:DNA-binding GntR family transcriptional regulator